MEIVIDDRYLSESSFIEQIPQLMAEGKGEIVYDKRNQVMRFRHHGLSLIVKRFKRVNFIQQVVYTFFRKSKAERAYLFANEFERRGINTPQRVAYMEMRNKGLFSVGYFVSLEAAGTESHLLLREVKDYDPQLADAVARQVVLMHSKGILHGDLNLSNFLCTQDADGCHFTMIDINRSHFCDGFPADEECIKNMVRLTHRRDLYEDLICRYARLRGWDADATVKKAIALLDRFENHRFRL
jgi:tRNA A-37 threonylcarbamoyl transferase component Bud32